MDVTTGPAMRGWMPRSRRRALVTTVALTAALVLSAAPEPLTSGPRPGISMRVPAGAAEVTPPAPYTDAGFTTFDYVAPDGTRGTWVLSPHALPLEMVLEQEVVDRFGRQALTEALTAWNGVDGSRFGVVVAGVTDAGLDRRRVDGVSRVFLDRTDCSGRYLARAHLYPASVEIRGEHAVAWLQEVDIGICERLQPDRLHGVVRHEVAHIAGLGHLCDAGSVCWSSRMAQDNRCRIMNPAAYRCQQRTRGDDDGIVYLHPFVSRLTGPGPTGPAAAVSRYLHPRPREASRIVLGEVRDDPDLLVAAALLAASDERPFLLVDEDCTAGPAGHELNRVARVGAEVLLVGDVPDACADQLATGWELEVDRAPDLRAVLDRRLASTSSPTRMVVVPRAIGDEPPTSPLAAPVAAALDAPVIPVGPGGVPGLVDDVLEQAPGIRVAVVLGGAGSVSPVVEQQLRERGLRIRRLDATDHLDLTERILRMRDVFGRGWVRAAFVRLDGPAPEAVAAAGLAAAQGRLVVGLEADRSPLEIDSRIRRGIVVGDGIPVDEQLTLSRLVDPR